MNKTRTRLIASVLVLVVAVALATTTTFAWFAMNSQVAVDGLNLNATIQGDLRISASEINSFEGSSYSATVSTDNVVLTPITLAAAPATGAEPRFIDMKQQTASETDYAKFDLYFASASQYKVFLNNQTLLNVANREGFAKVMAAVTAKACYVLTPNAQATLTNFVIEEVDGETPESSKVKRVKTVHVANNDGTSEDLTIPEDNTATIAGVAVTFAVEEEEGAERPIVSTTAANARVVNIDQLLEADTVNTLRIGIYMEDADFVVIDPAQGEGWSAYGDFNMAHTFYDAVSTTAVPDTLKTEKVAPKGFDTELFTLAAVSPFPTDDKRDTDPSYTAKVTVYIWMEGADPDCLATTASATLKGNLGFEGLWLQAEMD